MGRTLITMLFEQGKNIFDFAAALRTIKEIDASYAIVSVIFSSVKWGV